MAAGTCEKVRKNKDGTTSYRLAVMINGTRYRKTVRCSGDREAGLRLAEYVAECENASEAATRISFPDLAEKWLAVYADKKHKRSTLENERRKIAKWLSPSFTGPADAVTRRDVQAWSDSLHANGASPKTVRNLYGLLSGIYDWGVAMEYVPSTPCQYITLPKRRVHEARSLTREELSVVLSAVKKDANDYYYVAVVLAAFCGLRKGEILGLKWSDIDFDTGCLSVTRTRMYGENGTYIDTPKTVSGIRTVYMPDVVVDALERLRAAYAIKLVDPEYVLSHYNGRPVQPQALAGWVRRFRDAHPDLPIWSMHTLRHTHASMLRAIGAPLEEVQKRLGHADKITTQKIYIHLFDDADLVDKNTAQRINDFMSE